jgi:glycine betaine/choline ABC-type transport system substrate-binding protein
LAILIIILLIFVAGCQNTNSQGEEGSQNNEDKKVVIGSKPMAEQYILAEMLGLLIENHTDIAVEMKLGIAGGTSNLHPALENGDIDMYPEYSGTGWLFVLKEDLIREPDELFQKTKEAYKENYDLIWTKPYGFNNTFALAMKEKKAEELGIETFTDLSKHSSDLRFGSEYDFYDRDDGYPALVDTYGFNFKEENELDIALKYQAIDSEEVDVINSFSTDGLLKEYNMKVLTDDKNFFPSYQAATVVRGETLQKYPELEEVFDKLSGKITDDEMIEMNYQVEKKNRDPKKVAEEFLKEKGLI